MVRKLLGIGIIDEDMIKKVISEEKDKILIPITYDYDPQEIKQIAINYIYEHQSILDDCYQIPNKSLTVLIEDIYKAKNGYFQLNPLYKAHKFIQESPFSPKVHVPKIRPVISGINSPLLPMLKFISEICTFLIHVIQNEYNITNVVQDSYHVINIISNYIEHDYDINDTIMVFDFTSFYTELPYDFIQSQLTEIYHVFMNKYQLYKNDKYKIFANMIISIQNGYKIAAKYCVVNINDELYKQKEGVIMGASFAPSLANLVILIYIIRKNIQKCIDIKIIIRQIDDTLMICNNKNTKQMIKIFEKFHPKILEYTTEFMIKNRIQFLDILIIKIHDKLQYSMQIKPLKTEFYVPYTSNHPMHMKINIIKNMMQRAMILCSNYILFYHTIIALRLRFEKSGYPLRFINKYMDERIYKCREQIMNKLDIKRCNKLKSMLNKCKIKYKSIFRNHDEYLKLPYDNALNNRVIKHIKKTNKHNVVCKLNESIQKTIRRKEANSKLM